MSYLCEKYNLKAILLSLTEQEAGDFVTASTDISEYDEGVSIAFSFNATNNDELTLAIQESEDDVTWSDVDEGRLITPVYPIVHDDTDTIGETLLQVGVLSPKRYLRVSVSIEDQGNPFSSFISLIGKVKEKPNESLSSF